MKRLIITIIAFCAVVFSACDRRVTVQKTEPIMGTDVTITVVAPSPKEGEVAIDASMDELKRLDRMLSLYKDDSDVSRVNRESGKHPVKVSPETIEVVEDALKVSRMTHGVFDITVGPLVVLWQMRLKEGRVPTDGEISRVKRLVNYRNIAVDKNASTVFLKKAGMIMDLGGMKGYTTDRAAAVLKARGITNALVAVAGDIRAMGRRQDGEPWRIGVQHPRQADKLLATLELVDKSVSTSGDYERFTIVNHKRYHHIIDPRTGRPSTGVISVTLVGDPGALVDPLTKAPFILGPAEGMKLVREAGAEAIIVDEHGRVTCSPGIRLNE